MNQTAKEFGDVFLPAASSFEKDGTFMNAERRIQRVRKAIEPAGRSKADWEIMCAIAAAMGKGWAFSFKDPESIWNEVRTVWPEGRGISYSRIEHEGLRWPCPSDDHPGTGILHRDRFGTATRARLRPVAFVPTPEHVDADFPFLLTTGRSLYQFNAGTMTRRSFNNVLRPADTLDMAPADASRLSLQDGQSVRLVSRYGSAVMPLHVDDGMKPGELFATFHTSEVFLNDVIGPHRDSRAGTPEYKVTAVRVEKAR
jgi:formate dehydrogenase major subunit